MSKYKYILGDSLKAIKKFKDNTFKLIITSPPYNVGKEYETKKSIELYLEEQNEIIKELVRVLHTNGSICWQVGNFVDDKEIFPLDIFYYQIFKDNGLKLRNRIVWQFGHGLHSSKRFSGRYETILWFTKTEDYTFNLDSVRIPSKYPGKRHHKGPKKGQYSSNPKGKNPSDIWEVLLNDWEKEIWNIPNVKSNHVEKTEHPCQYPIELVERCVLALTNENDWILDPFAGVGSTVLASLKNDRNVIGIEKVKKYRDIGVKRVKEFDDGSLRFRSIGTPIYDHTKSKLSQIPLEFNNNESLRSI
ncbi:DNA-methyltransferase [Parapedobacter tibetensis]|uniref:DNA-methyltransferase n=1 Tax=Parapedobacter tibetensis TaxID=2972951 RepID=UPI00214D4D30|nr:site-specific DNA-methyltransferase [Parapedobacter tibetensis]